MTSLWEASAVRPQGYAKALEGDRSADVLVIGGGIAGVLCAYLLAEAGCRCVLVEGGQVGAGVTANTTAKVTAQHGLVYDRLIKKRGADAARLYFEANQAAVAGLRVA